MMQKIQLSAFFTITILLFHGIGAQTCTHSRTIQSGDTCDSIAQKKQCSNAQLLYINPTLKCNNLPVGKKICTATPDYDCQPVVQVEKGDSCYSIANRNQITQQQFIRNNPGINCDTLYPGKMVCIAKSAPGQTSTTLTATSIQPTATSHGACTHSRTIKEGDTCDSIAKEKGASRYQLQKVNPGLDCSNLHVSDKICTATAEYDCQPVDGVISGDTCYDLAKRNSISLDQLLIDNPGLDCNALFVDQTLCVATNAPGQKHQTTTTTTITTTTSHIPVTTPTSTACSEFSTVEENESCESIGKKFSRTRPDLERLNSDHNNLCGTLIQGAGICIDGPLRQCDKTQEVKSGDSCYGLAESAKISLDDFYKINPDIDSSCSNLSLGQIICLAPRTDYAGSIDGEFTCTRRTTIRVGDTCERIAARASLTSLQLHGLNPNLNCSEIVIGEDLCSFATSINLCPESRIVKFNDTCYDLAQNASMSLEEWKGIQSYKNEQVDCDALSLSQIVCQSRGNATIPSLSGDNANSSPRCSSTCDYKSNCCSAYSICMPLGSEYCDREQGCQENCQGDSGVNFPQKNDETVIGGPDDGFNNTSGIEPVSIGCENCSKSECCATIGKDEDKDGNERIIQLCMKRNTWFCLADNGCTSNCMASIYDYDSIIDPYYYHNETYTPQFVFPAGDYSDNDGNPCYGCSEEECCTSDIKCHSLENDKNARCWVAQGCLFNCNAWDYDDTTESEEFEPEPTSTRIKEPFATQTISSTVFSFA